jgi:hypothetical protein
MCHGVSIAPRPAIRPADVGGGGHGPNDVRPGANYGRPPNVVPTR